VATPQWLEGSLNGNATPGGSPFGSVVTKTAGADSTFNATARTADLLQGVGSFTFSANVSQDVFIGLTAQTASANLDAAADYPYGISISGGFASLFHAGAYVTDLNASVLSGVHVFKIEVFDSGGGVLKVRYYIDDEVKLTESAAASLPQALGMVIATLTAAVTNISVIGGSIDNEAPVVDAGADIDILEGQDATLDGSATDDGLPSATLTYLWTKVSGPGTVTFVDATLAQTTASFTALGVYVLRLTVSDGELTGSDDINVTVTEAPAKPVAPLSYTLDVSTDVFTEPALPSLTAAGQTITDPSFGTPVTRLTDQNTNAGESFGTSSGPATNGWASDDSAYLVVGEEGSYRAYDFDPATGVSTPAETFISGVEPTFSRDINKPHILYATEQSNSLVIKARNRLTNAWTPVYDLRTDVPSLTAGADTYMGAVYNSEDDPELLVTAFGATQDLFPYVTIVNADDTDDRVTVDVFTAKIKVNGGAWAQLLNHDGSNSTISVGLHSVSIDRTGEWVQLFYSGTHGGAKRGAFFNMGTNRIHEYNHDKWFGHDSLGRKARVTMASGIAKPPQWEFTDLEQGGVFPTGLFLIDPAEAGDWYLTDHNNWNNARQDGELTPFIVGTQITRGGIGGPVNYGNLANWGPLWDEIAAISTDQAAVKGTDMWWRACHHRNALIDSQGRNVATFRDSPRPQVSHGGMYVLFTSNWGLSLGTRGNAMKNGVIPINHRRDLFMVRMSTTGVGNDPPTVSLTSPTEGATSTVPGSFTLTATASDPDGTIAHVRFYAGATLLATITSEPYTFNWTNAGPGNYAVTAVAQDNDGLTTTSNTRNVTVTAIQVVVFPQVVATNGQELSGTSDPPGTTTFGAVRDFVVPVRDVQGAYVNLAAATSIQFIFRKPSGVIITRTGSKQSSYAGSNPDIIAAQAANAVARYVTAGSDLDARGIWRSQVKIVIGGVTYYTEPTALEVT